MTRWFDRLRFLWEEEIAPPEEVPRSYHGEPAGVPRRVRTAVRWLLIAIAASTLMGQIIGTSLVPPVAAYEPL